MLKVFWPRAWMREIERRLERLAGLGLEPWFGHLSGRVHKLEEEMASVQELEAGLSALRQSIADLSGRIASIVQTSAALAAKIDLLQQQLDAGAQIPDADVQAIADDVTQIQQLAQSSS